MRAIITVSSSIPLNEGRTTELEALFQRHRWLAPDKYSADKAFEHVIDDVSATDKPTVINGYAFSLARAGESVQGIVGVDSSNGVIQLRLRAPSVVDLKRACSAMVDLFLASNHSAAHEGGMNFGFKFEHHVHILSGSSKEMTWDGVVHTETPWKAAVRDEKAQARVLYTGLFATLVAFIVSIPGIAHALFDPLFHGKPDYYDWLTGYIGRAASAFLFAAIVAYLNQKLRVDELRREGAIAWTHV